MGQIKDRFLFIHIPRTAGTTFYRILEETYGEDNCERDESKLWCSQIQDLSADIIHGHFDIDRYKHFNRPRVTFVRDPVDRLISEYYFLSATSKRVLASKTIREYAEARANIMANFHIKDINNFEFIGIQEQFNESLNRFEEWAGIKLVRGIPPVNVATRDSRNHANPPTKWEGLTDDDKKYIRKVNDKDYNLYYKIIDLFGKTILPYEFERKYVR